MRSGGVFHRGIPSCLVAASVVVNSIVDKQAGGMIRSRARLPATCFCRKSTGISPSIAAPPDAESRFLYPLACEFGNFTGARASPGSPLHRGKAAILYFVDPNVLKLPVSAFSCMVVR